MNEGFKVGRDDGNGRKSIQWWETSMLLISKPSASKRVARVPSRGPWY